MVRSVMCALMLVATLYAGGPLPPEQPAPGQVWRDPASGIEFCYCPPGTFQMGTVEEEPYQETNQRPRHSATLSHGFWIGRTEITQRQWVSVMGSLPPPPKWKDAPKPESPSDEAVTEVSWNECQEFLRRLNDKAGKADYRLPTEAEWEFACEAGVPPKPDQGWGIIGQSLKPSEPNAWGLIAMLGPVGEWCSDWAGSYPAGPVTDPQGSGPGLYKVSRGGWGFKKKHIHPTWRWFYTPDFKYEDLGLRIVRVID